MYTFEYNQNGLRKKKSNYRAGTYVTYTYEGDLLVKQYDGTNKLFYLYDENNKLYGLIWNGTKYFYKRNIIDEIVGIVAFDGTVVVEYSYDPFGKLLSTTGSLSSTLGVLNSMLYKGYVYDHESALYYCKTRFYYPEICRWISEDSTRYLDPSSVNGLNLYSYCYNNPIFYSDPSGRFVITLSAILWAAAIGAAVGAISGAFYGGLTAVANYQNVWAGIGIGALAGGIMGAGAGVASLFIAPVLVGEGVMVATATGAGFVMGNVLSTGAALAIGTSIAFGSGAIGGVTSDILIQKANNGNVSDWGSLGISALQWGLINTIGAFLGSIYGPLSYLETVFLSGAVNNITGEIGLIVDVIRDRINKRKQTDSLSYIYCHGF